MAEKTLKSPETCGKKIKFSFLKQIPKNVVIAVFIFIAAITALKNENQKSYFKTLGLETKLKKEQEIIYQWEKILTEKPDYRDGWLQLSALYYKAGNIKKAKEVLLKAKEIDPTNETVLVIERLLSN